MTRFVTDSSSDIRDEEYEDVAIAPMEIYTDEKAYHDDGSLDVHEMLEYLAAYKGRSYTSCPSVDSWLKAYEGADTLYVFPLTSKLSGGFNSATTAATVYKESHPDARIKVFNTLTTGPELAMQLEKARELTANGLDFDDVCSRIEDYISRTRLFFSLKSFHNFAQNGRIPKALAAAIGVLGLRILCTASTKGDVEPIGKCKGERKTAIESIARMVKAGYFGGKTEISHVENPELAELVKKAILTEFPDASVIIRHTRGLCSYYAEQGGILIGMEAREPRTV